MDTQIQKARNMIIISIDNTTKIIIEVIIFSNSTALAKINNKIIPSLENIKITCMIVYTFIRFYYDHISFIYKYIKLTHGAHHDKRLIIQQGDVCQQI